MLIISFKDILLSKDIVKENSNEDWWSKDDEYLRIISQKCILILDWRAFCYTTSTRFQLEYMGHLLKREVRTDLDPRVKHFIPDTWQVYIYRHIYYA